MEHATRFKWRHFEAAIMLLCVRWYLRYALRYRDLEEMMRERGLSIDHTTIYRWVQHYAPELEKRCRLHLKAWNDSWKVDETYIKVKKVWMYLYRAVASEGNTIEFLLSPTRDAEAAKRFFLKALQRTTCPPPQDRLPLELMKDPSVEDTVQPTASARFEVRSMIPRVINVDKNAAYPKATAGLKAAGVLPEHVELRQVKYLNNLIEQDHRAHQTLDQARDGLFLLRNSLANRPRLRGDEHAEEGAGTRSEQRRWTRAGRTGRQTLWSCCLS